MRSASVASEALSTVPTRESSLEQVRELFERGVLVVDRENDQAAAVVVTVHDLLILRSGRPRAGAIFAPAPRDHGDCETV